MDYRVQLFSFLVSFLFGIFFSFVSRFHYELVFSLKKVLRYVLTFLFILDLSLLYILLMYYVNHGNLHLYFIFLTFIGYFVEKPLILYVKRHVKLFSIIDKYWHK